MSVTLKSLKGLGLKQAQIDLLFGSLLGDGSLQPTSVKGNSWRYRVLQQALHEEYVMHKYELLKSFCGSTPSYSETSPDVRTGTVSKRYYFNTLTGDCFKGIADLFYVKVGDQWIKRLPLNIEEFLTPAAIAYWYMDDGALKWRGHSNAMRVCTENFTIEEVARLQAVLLGLYGIRTTTTRKVLANGEVRHRIAIPERSSAAFRELIKPHLVNCMRYKVSDGNRGDLSSSLVIVQAGSNSQ